MLFLKVIVLVVIISIVTWLAMKFFDRPMSFGLVVLFWIAVLFLGGALFFGLSTWVAGLNNF